MPSGKDFSMDRVTIVVFLALGAIVAIALKAPPKVYENVRTYYKTLIQAPAAQVNAYSNRAIHKPVKPPVVAQPVKPPARTPASGPQITVLGGIPWERESHASRARVTSADSETQTSAATQEPTAVASPDTQPQEHVASTSEELVPQAQ